MSHLINILPQQNKLSVRVSKIEEFYEFKQTLTYRNALINSIFKNYLKDYFAKLSKQEFSLLLNELKTISEKSILLYFKNEYDAEIFFKHLCIFSKYKIYSKHSFTLTLEKYINRGHYSFKEHFKHLFINTKISSDFINSFLSLEIKDIEVLLWITNSNDIESKTLLEIPISKEETHYFNTKNGLLRLLNNKSNQYRNKRAIAAIFANTFPDKIQLINGFLTRVKFFNQTPLEFHLNINYWINLFQLIPLSMDIRNLDNLLGFIEYHYDKTPINTERKNLESIKEEMYRWIHLLYKEYVMNDNQQHSLYFSNYESILDEYRFWTINSWQNNVFTELSIDVKNNMIIRTTCEQMINPTNSEELILEKIAGKERVEVS